MSADAVLLRRLTGGALFLIALGASVAAGVPADAGMPEVALGSPLLLHLERAALMVGILGLSGLVIWRAGRGEFPDRLGHIEYEAESATATKEMLASVESRLVLLEQLTGVRGNGVDEGGNGA